MALQLYNTRSKNKEIFKPIDETRIGMYACGPTVYDRAHLGNARAMVVFDCLYRVLCECYGKESVIYVRNITDVDDKINKAAKERQSDIATLTAETTALFHHDMEAIGCLPPVVEPRATEHIPHMLAMIETLVKRGHAYAAEGHVLFAVDSFEHYGNLSRRSQKEMIAGARVEVAPYKKSPGDFVLWKPSSDDEPGWGSPWGRGRPGWHIECSAMSTHYLGADFDIHAGGADLQFPHHENEIAQSCCANEGSDYAHTWVHNGFLTVESEKMSKSLGNFVTVHDLLDAKHIQGEVIRYALLSAHYRKPLDWSEKLVSDAQKALDHFYRLIEEYDGVTAPNEIDGVLQALYDDLNTPLAIANLHQLAKTASEAKENKQQALANLYHAGKIMGIFASSAEAWFASDVEIDAEAIEALIAKRYEARKEKNWAEADRLRDEIEAKGVILEDKPDGSSSWHARGRN